MMPFEIDEAGELIVDDTISSAGLRSDRVSEIMSDKPSFLIRWGITIFFLIIVCIVASCWFIKYPDVVTARAKLTSVNAPKEIKTKTDGKLLRFFAKDGQKVHRLEILGYMESTAAHKDVIELSKTTDELQAQINNNQPELIQNMQLRQLLNLGEVQQHYQTFIQAQNVFKQYLSTGFYVKKKHLLNKDLEYLERLHKNLIIQKTLQEEDLALQKENFKANEYLKNEKVISAFEFRTEKSKLISKELTVPQISSAIISNETNRHEKLKEILELENLVAQQKEIFKQALSTFKSQLDEWKSKYLLTASVEGKVAFATFIEENQEIKNNRVICYINPENSSYYAEVLIPQYNFGKIKKQQKVLLQFPSYPSQEFGKLEGELEFISHIPTDSGYLSKVIFPNGLNTNFNKTIQYREGLTAQADIITADMNLLERLFTGMRNIIKQ